MPPPPPTKVLRILTRLNIGGPAIHAALLSTQLHPERFATCLVVGESDAIEGDLGQLVDGHKVQLVRLKTLRRQFRPWKDFLTFIALLRLLSKERPHIIHTHMAKAGALGRLAALCYNTVGPGRKPRQRAIVIHTFHGHVLEGYFSPRVSQFFIRIERWLARVSDALIAVSPTIRDELLQKRIGRPEQWRVIPLGLDLAVLSQLPPPNGTASLRCGLVGRLVPIKNPSLFLNALDRVVRQQAGISMTGVLVGDGPLRAHLEQEVKRLGLDSLVRFTGWQQDLRSVYEELEVTCVTSWNEGTPVALIEAMAAGRTVVATDVGGVRDVLDDEGTQRMPIAAGAFLVTNRGILVRPGDVEGLAGALTAIARNAALRQRLGHAARSYVVERFSEGRLCRDIMALYDEGLARRTG